MNPIDFGSYLAGLFEGDGHITMPSLKHRHNPRFHITFHKKDYPLAKKLMGILGFGFIRHKHKQNACVLTVSEIKAWKLILRHINGKLKTPKISMLHLAIDWLNHHHKVNAIKYDLNSDPISDSAWLAGFIDADGSFHIRNTKQAPQIKKRIACRFRLEQRIASTHGESYEQIISAIASYLQIDVKYRKQAKTSRVYYLIDVSSKATRRILNDYLMIYPLYSSKYLDYKDYYAAGCLLDEKNAYSDNGMILITILKSEMNNCRTVFNWDHLNKLEP